MFIVYSLSGDNKKIAKFLVNNKIDFQFKKECRERFDIDSDRNVKSDRFEIDSDYFVKTMIFFSKNDIQYQWCNKNEFIKKLIKEKKLDDFSLLYDKKVILECDMSKFLQKACRKCDAETVSHLLSYDVKKNMHKLLNIACWRSDDNVDIVRILLDYMIQRLQNKNALKRTKPSAKLPHDENAKNNESTISDFLTRQPLNNAAEQGNFEVVRLLIDYGANPKFNNYAIRLALNNNNIDVAELLISYGSDFAFDEDTFIISMSKNEPMAEMVELYYKQVFKENERYVTKTRCVSQISFGSYIDKTLGLALIAAAKTGSLETVIALVDIGVNLKKYKSEALIVSKKRPHIYKYLKTIDLKSGSSSENKN